MCGLNHLCAPCAAQTREHTLMLRRGAIERAVRRRLARPPPPKPPPPPPARAQVFACVGWLLREVEARVTRDAREAERAEVRVQGTVGMGQHG